jgi:hypothetical protein
VFDFMHHKIIFKNVKEGNVKKVFMGFAMIVLLLCLTTAPASAQTTGKCTVWYWDWQMDGTFLGPLYTWADDNGTFQNQFGEFGTWYEFKGERAFIMDPSYYDGFWVSKKIGGGAMIQYNITPVLHGVWYSKGTSKKNCNFVTAGVQASQVGLSTAKPE